MNQATISWSHLFHVCSWNRRLIHEFGGPYSWIPIFMKWWLHITQPCPNSTLKLNSALSTKSQITWVYK